MKWMAPVALLAIGGCYLSHEPEEPLAPPPPRTGEETAVIAAGPEQSCAIVTDGTLRCWGMGDPDPEVVLEAGAMDMSNDGECLILQGGVVDCRQRGLMERASLDAVKVSVGVGICALSRDGTLWCLRGQTFERARSDVVDVSVGRGHVCAVTRGSDVLCWGANNMAQAAAQGIESVPMPGMEHSLPAPAQSVSAGEEHTCVLIDQRVFCWGRNGEGQLGDGILDHGSRCRDADVDAPVDCSFEAVEVEGISDAVQVSAGLFHSCALHESGQISCWGSNAFGRLGDGVEAHGYICGDADCSPTPIAVVDIEDGRQVAAGRLHTCALEGPTGVRCWGANFRGQLGDGTYTHRNRPTVVPLL